MSVVSSNHNLVEINNEVDLYLKLKESAKDANLFALIEIRMDKNSNHDYLKVIEYTDEVIQTIFINFKLIKYGNLSYFIISSSNNIQAFKIAVDTKLMTARSYLNKNEDKVHLTVKFADVRKDDLVEFPSAMRIIESLRNKAIYNKVDANFDAIINSYKIALFECTVETEQHCGRLSYYNKRISEEMKLNAKDIQRSYALGWLHDIGKIAIEDSILNKPAKLDEYEWIRMEEHPVIGWKMLKDIPGFEEIAEGVKFHHERYDGNGYPDKIPGDKIPLIARITTVTDSFDTILSKRVYKNQMPLDYAIDELIKNKGKQFDPDVVDTFIRLIANGEFNHIIESYKN